MGTGFVRPNGLRKNRKNEVSFEARWAMAAKAGFTLAFEELVSRNESRIYRLSLGITQNQQDAEDLLQNTFIEAQEHLQEFRGDSSFSSWVVQVCIRTALLKFRERDPNWAGRDESAESNDDLMQSEPVAWGDCPKKGFSKTELNRILSGAICKLTLLHRIVFLLRYVESFSTREIANLLGLSVSAARLHLLRAHLDVREYLNCYFGLNVSAESNCAGSVEASRAGQARAISKTAVA